MSDTRIKFTSLGTVILDEIHFPSGEVVRDVIGGSGTYGTLGARLFHPPPASQSIGWIVRVGRDFPTSARATLESWGTTLVYSEEPGCPSPRSLIEYRDQNLDGGEAKQFKYLTPILKIDPFHLKSTPLLNSSIFHFLANPSDLRQDVTELLNLRRAAGCTSQPLIIWEPRPSACSPDHLDASFEAARMVDIFSPNHTELAALFGTPLPPQWDKPAISNLATKFLTSSSNHGGIIVVRAGEQGCFVKTASSSSQQPSEWWLPAYYDPHLPTSAKKVVDTTGAGNAFIGGFATKFLESGKNPFEAACYATVAASFAVEQIGLPLLLSRSENDAEHEELWNNASARVRVEEYKSRIRDLKGKFG